MELNITPELFELVSMITIKSSLSCGIIMPPGDKWYKSGNFYLGMYILKMIIK